MTYYLSLLTNISKTIQIQKTFVVLSQYSYNIHHGIQTFVSDIPEGNLYTHTQRRHDQILALILGLILQQYNNVPGSWSSYQISPRTQIIIVRKWIHIFPVHSLGHLTKIFVSPNSGCSYHVRATQLNHFPTYGLQWPPVRPQKIWSSY